MEINEKIEGLKKKISDSEKNWSAIVDLLAKKLQNKDLKDLSELQAESISYHSMAVDEINVYGKQIYHEKKRLKILLKQRFEFYATSYQIKTSGSEKLRLIEADLADIQELIDMYDLHCNHLQEKAKEIDKVYWGIKQKGELYKIFNGIE